MTIAKHIVQWNGLPGSPGYSLFYQNNSVGNPAPLQTFFAAIQAYIPTTVTVVVGNSGELIDELTGKMTGVWSAGTTASTPGTVSSAYAPQAGAQVKWGTNNFRNGRRVWGRSFMVPLVVTAYATGGILSTTVANAIQAAGANLITGFAGSMVVWSRPVYRAATTPGDPPVLVRQGAISPIVSATCPTKSATLNGRRDT